MTGAFDGFVAMHLQGWVAVPEGRPPAHVQVFVDRRFFARMRADIFRPDLLAAGFSNGGRAGFYVPFEPALAGRRNSVFVEVVVEGTVYRLLGSLRLPGGQAQNADLAALPLTRSLWFHIARQRGWTAVLAARLLGARRPAHSHGREHHSDAARSAIAPASAQEAPSRPAPGRPERLSGRMHAPYAEVLATEGLRLDQDETLGEQDRLRFRIFGHIDGHYSLSGINRGLALGLSAGPGSVVINHFHGAHIDGLPQQIGGPMAARIDALIQRWDEEAPDDGERISICHHYPLAWDERAARLRLAFFFWEETRVPEDHVHHLNRFDAILVATQFVRKVLRDSGCWRPIRVVPIGVDVAALAVPTSDPYELAAIRPLRFLHVSSAFPRKGLDVLLEAYFAEFTGTDDVELIIKTFSNIHNTTGDQIARLRAAYRDAPAVTVNERFLNEAELATLYQSCDVVVLPTRGEGFNLPAAEAMSLGKPVIATGYGGQWDFLTGRTGWCLDFEFSPSESHLASIDALWLEPNRDHLRALMREFASTAGRSTVRGQNVGDTTAAGSALVRKVYTWAGTARVVRDYADRLLSHPDTAPDTLRVAWLSSWNCKCGIAEYSRMLTSEFDTRKLQLTFVCDTRSAAETNVLPLYTAHPAEQLGAALHFIASEDFDVVALQYQPSLFDLAAALPGLVALQKRSPVFLFMHSTRQFTEAPPVEATVQYLRRLERIFVHTLDDISVLKGLDLIENVTLLRQGVGAPVTDGAAPHERRFRIGHALAGLERPALVGRDHDLLASRLQEGEFWLASFGFLLPHKGIIELIEAVRRIHDVGCTGVRLLLLCATLDERSGRQAIELRATIERLGLGEAVTVVNDFLSVPEVTTLLAAVDLLVYPYQETFESASAAIRMGLASGRPILTTPLRIFEEVSAFTFRSRNGTPDALAEAILPLVSDPEKLRNQQHRQDAWIAVCQWSRIAERLSAMFFGTIADCGLAPGAMTRYPCFDRCGTRNVSDINLPVPLCPPGVDYPRTGRGRSWLVANYHLASARAVIGERDFAVAWQPDRLVLVLANGPDAGKPLHLAPSRRSHLLDAVLTVDADDIIEINERERPAFFQYARRHGMRTVVRGGLGELDPATILADLVCASADGAWNPRAHGLAPTLHPRSGSPVPQVCFNETVALACPEVLTIRRLHVRGADAAGSSRLLAALRKVANRALSLDGDRVISFEPRQAEDHGWCLLCAASLAASDLSEPSALPGRSALLIDAAGLGTLIDAKGIVRWLLGFKLIVFEDPLSYRDFFSALCRRKAPIALLRERAVLLAVEGEESCDSVVDRFARLLRTTHPLRLRDVIAPCSPLDSPPVGKAAKTLSICVSTYNRAAWLRVTLPLLLAEAAPHHDRVEFLVVDNASTDSTERAVAELAAGTEWVTYVRNPVNVGMLGNLAVTARLAKGDFVWIIGDDDLVKPGTVLTILNALRIHPRTELVYLNYAYTHFDQPSDLRDVPGLLASATPIASETPSGFHEEVRAFAARNENFFTAIYACVFRRDHALAAYGQFTSGPPFSDLASCIPTTKYVLEHMLDRPGYWIGDHQIVVNMNVSWMRYAPVWHLERLPEVYNLAEEMGVAPDELNSYRVSNLNQAVHFTPSGFGEVNGVLNLLSMSRYIEKARGVDGLADCVDVLLSHYELARVKVEEVGDAPSTGTLRSIYGL